MDLEVGIVIKSIKYQETSKIITILNNGGLSTYYVRGGASYKSKNFSYSNELTKIAFDYTEGKNKGFKILKSGNILDNYSNIKQDYTKLANAILILELTNQLGAHINDFTTFYSFLEEILAKLNSNNYSDYYYIIFRLKLLYLLGVGPQFTRCVVCGKKEDLVGFKFTSGGMECIDCLDDRNSLISKDLTNSLKVLYLMKLDAMDDEFFKNLEFDLALINEFLDRYYNHFLGYSSKANKVLEKL